MTKQEKIREGIARKLAYYAPEVDEWENLSPFKQQVYLDQALAIMEYEDSQGVVIKVDRELPCLRCKGSGSIEVGVLRGGVFKGNDIDCQDCKGTGKAGYVAVEPLTS